MLKIIECTEDNNIFYERIDHMTLESYTNYLDYLHELYDKGEIYYLAVRKRYIVNVFIRKESNHANKNYS